MNPGIRRGENDRGKFNIRGAFGITWFLSVGLDPRFYFFSPFFFLFGFLDRVFLCSLFCISESGGYLMDKKTIIFLILFLVGSVSAYNASVRYPINSSTGLVYDEANNQLDDMTSDAYGWFNYLFLGVAIMCLAVLLYAFGLLMRRWGWIR